MIAPEFYIGLASVMFVLGTLGVLIQKNAVRILISVEIMLNSANVALVGFNGLFARNNVGYVHDGTIFAFIIIGVAAAEAAVGLAIFLSLYRNFNDITVSNIFGLREKED